MIKITIRRYNANRKPEPLEIDAYACGDHLAVHKNASGNRWLVTHKASGNSVTGGRFFSKKTQAMRYGLALQEHLDFSLLKPTADMAWDVRAAFGQEAIRRAMSVSFAEAFAA